MKGNISRIKRAAALLAALVLALGLAAPASAADTVRGSAEASAARLAGTEPAAGSEWAVLCLARSGLGAGNGYFAAYDAAETAYVRTCAGVLSAQRYTEYAKTVLALTAIGRDPTDVGGYNLLKPLGDYNRTVRQGINGAAYALLALDCGGYAVPENPDAAVQATRELYVSGILAQQHADGGFGLAAASDTDVTAIVLQALAPYQNRADAAAAVSAGLSYLSTAQNADGGCSSYGAANCESTAQVILALCALGVSPEDARFVKSGHTLTGALLGYRAEDGAFAHTAGGAADALATAQAMLALTALLRAENGQTSLYDMSDVPAGLSGKNPDVHCMLVTKPGCTFSDVSGSGAKTAIEAMAAREIVDGYDDGSFLPGKSMTRAEFAAIVVRALGLTPAAGDAFEDVPSYRWFAPYIGAAYAYGIVDGMTDTTFEPDSTITREQAAAMVTRAAKLCGLNTVLDKAAADEILARLSDADTVSNWARPYAAFCCGAGIVDDAEPFRAQDETLRQEMTQMLYNLLGSAKLL